SRAGMGPPHPPFGHLLPRGEKDGGDGLRHFFPSPPVGGGGAQRREGLSHRAPWRYAGPGIKAAALRIPRKSPICATRPASAGVIHTRSRPTEPLVRWSIRWRSSATASR